jgi:excinuclease ABC subunit A
LPCPRARGFLVLGPLIKDRKTEGDRIIDAAKRQGFVRVRVDGEQYDIAEAPPKLDKYKRHSIEVIVDRYIVRYADAPDGAARAEDGRPIDPETGLVIPDPDASRLADSIETALRLGEGVVLIAPAPRDGEEPAFAELRYSEKYSCPYDGFTIDELEPRSFSFNSPHGACPSCAGPRHEARDRPAPPDPRPEQEPRQRRARAGRPPVHGGLVADEDHRGGLRGPRLGLPRPVKKLPAEAIEYLLRAEKDQERVIVRYRHERGENTYKANFEGSSPTSSAATGRPSPTTSRPRSRSSWSPSRARPAAASGSDPRSSRSRSGSRTSGTSAPGPSRTR